MVCPVSTRTSATSLFVRTVTRPSTRLQNWICWTLATTKMTSFPSVLQGVLHYPGLPHFIPHPTRSALVPTSAISWTRWTWRSLSSSPAPPSSRRAWRNFVVATPNDPDRNHRVQSISIDYREISRVQRLISDHRRQCLRVGTFGWKTVSEENDRLRMTKQFLYELMGSYSCTLFEN